MRTNIQEDKEKVNGTFSNSTIKNEKVFKSSNLNNRIQSFEENFNSNNIKNKKYNKKLLKQNKKLKKLIKEYKEKRISSRNRQINSTNLPERNNLNSVVYWKELKENMIKSKQHENK